MPHILLVNGTWDSTKQHTLLLIGTYSSSPKWENNSNVLSHFKRGFQSHYGYYLGEQNYFSHSRDHGYDWRDNWDISWEDKGLYSTHMITDRAEKIIRHHNHSQPLFLYLSYQGTLFLFFAHIGCVLTFLPSYPSAVHKPWFAPEKYSEPYKHITDETRRTYCGVVACLDESIGNITKTLQELHLWEDTIIIFTSGISILLVLSHTLMLTCHPNDAVFF